MSTTTKHMLRILRKRQVLEYIPVGETKLEEEFIKTGRLRKIPLGERAYGFAEDNVQEVIRELIASADKPTKRRGRR